MQILFFYFKLFVLFSSLFSITVSQQNINTNYELKKPILNFQKEKNKFKLIFPGMKWCGMGYTAKSIKELGWFRESDACCRGHDLCPDYIYSGETRHGLLNKSHFVASHCDCDEELYKCLKKNNNFVSWVMGKTYFTLLNFSCFRKSRPIIKCAEKIQGRCVEYQMDEEGDEIYQWFDNPVF